MILDFVIHFGFLGKTITKLAILSKYYRKKVRHEVSVLRLTRAVKILYRENLKNWVNHCHRLARRYPDGKALYFSGFEGNKCHCGRNIEIASLLLAEVLYLNYSCEECYQKMTRVVSSKRIRLFQSV